MGPTRICMAAILTCFLLAQLTTAADDSSLCKKFSVKNDDNLQYMWYT